MYVFILKGFVVPHLAGPQEPHKGGGGRELNRLPCSGIRLVGWGTLSTPVRRNQVRHMYTYDNMTNESDWQNDLSACRNFNFKNI